MSSNYVGSLEEIKILYIKRVRLAHLGGNKEALARWRNK